MLYELLDNPGRGWPRSFGRVGDRVATRTREPEQPRGPRPIAVRLAQAEPEVVAQESGWATGDGLTEPDDAVLSHQESVGSGPTDQQAAGPTPTDHAQVDEAAPAHDPTDAERLRRAIRELEAAKGRVEREAERVAQQTRSQLIERLLPVLDNLDRSIESANGENAGAVLEGLKLVRGQFEDVLLGFGLERLDCVGQRFDPAIHEAVAVAEVDDAEKHGKVVDEWEPGYRLGGRLLRAAKVRVGRLA